MRRRDRLALHRMCPASFSPLFFFSFRDLIWHVSHRRHTTANRPASVETRIPAVKVTETKFGLIFSTSDLYLTSTTGRGGDVYFLRDITLFGPLFFFFLFSIGRELCRPSVLIRKRGRNGCFTLLGGSKSLLMSSPNFYCLPK